MWESVLKKEQWEVQFDPDHKSLRLHISKNGTTEERAVLQLDQAELFELLHTFLTINRSFNNESMYYDDQEALDPA